MIKDGTAVSVDDYETLCVLYDKLEELCKTRIETIKSKKSSVLKRKREQIQNQPYKKQRLNLTTSGGSSPHMFNAENSLFRFTLPGIQLDPEKIDLASQYLYIDQLIMNLNLCAKSNVVGTVQMSSNRREFLKKMQSESWSKNEFSKLSASLSKPLQASIFSQKPQDFSTYFSREGITIHKPYLSKDMRDRFNYEIKDKYVMNLIRNDIVHVPFSDSERRIIDKNLKHSISSLCELLPGRSVLDICRYLQENYSSNIESTQSNLDQDIITYKNHIVPKHDSVTSNGSMSTILKEITYSNPSLSKSSSYQKKVLTKTLLKTLKLVGMSTAPTEAIVDCKLDPTGLTKKMIIGTAKNESNNTNVNTTAANISLLYDLEEGTIQSLDEHVDTVSASSFTIDGKHIVTASFDKQIIVRRSSDGVVEKIIGHTDESAAAAASREGAPTTFIHSEPILNMVLHKKNINSMASFSTKEIFIWNLESGKLHRDLTRGHPVTGAVVDMCFAEGDYYADMLIVGGEASNKKGEIRIYDTISGVMLNSVMETRGMISSVATNSTSWVVSATKQVLKLFDIRNPMNTTATFKTGQKDVNTVSFSPCERYIQSSATDNRCIIFDIRRPDHPLHILQHLPPIGHNQSSGLVGINTAVWTPDKNFLVTGGEDGCVRVWDMLCAEPLVNSFDSFSPICACDVSQASDMIVAGDEAATVRLWSSTGSGLKLNDEDLRHIGISDERQINNETYISVEPVIEREESRTRYIEDPNAPVFFAGYEDDSLPSDQSGTDDEQ
eukprot:TRINITY_DN7812_c0_g1_i2.p1 TRINITY_DN7812_c0_g1~~TRINITY_DN7812_c0_g1_i2.p1  ORF type:complete len:780 (+),score=182.90 TRINITY_DN7812_c0_g1_i2:11-2350(+)